MTATAMLAIASAIDIRKRRIPNWLSAGGFITGLVIAYTHDALFGAITAALVSMLAMSSPNLFGAGAVGAGDVKLAGAMGVLLGMASVLLIIGAAACGAFVAIVLLNRMDWIRMRPNVIPFAPLLLGGYLLVAWVRIGVT
ncbi:MAG: prepilin peptidase [Chloroflexi bacterium]|nr:prepilin peptidase [Chloroflexota bacterium]